MDERREEFVEIIVKEVVKLICVVRGEVDCIV